MVKGLQVKKKKISTYAKENDLTYRTVWNMVTNNLLPYEKTPTGTILILDQDKIEESYFVQVALYARVSSSENKSNLDSQMQRLKSSANAKGWIIKYEIKEIGSGLNDK